MANAPPPPYSGPNQGPSYPPADTGKQPIPPDGVQAPGYPPQTAPGYPSHAQAPYPGYPPQPAPGYPPQHAGGQPGYPPQGQGYIQQQPAPSHFSTTNNTTVVVTQQPTTTVATVIPYVNDYMGLSIFSCLCCCWIIGIFAIIKSSEARSNYNAGNYQQAVASATTARNASYISIFCGIGIYILIIVLSSA